MTLTSKEIADCVRVLETLVEDRAHLASAELSMRNRLLAAAGRVSRPERNEQRVLSRALRKKEKKEARASDELQLSATGIRQMRRQPVFITPDPRALADAARGTPDASALPEADLNFARACYVCKVPVKRVHFFYDQMCASCGDFNYRKRSNTADLSGRVALISGARVKIGYQAAMMLLRAGARVLVSTRFPRDAALRYSREADFGSFADRLQIHALDLRHTPSVEAFAQKIIRTEERLDFIIHNACQTVRRPPGFYEHLVERELGPVEVLPAAARQLLAAHDGPAAVNPAERALALAGGRNGSALELPNAPALSQQILTAEDLEGGYSLFPPGALDADLQQVDLREANSWRLALEQVGTVELLEVQLVNAIAPFVLNARLKPLMLRHPTRDKHIVNVSAMEGQFYRLFKTDKHPHTNMAKAALNMMTRTSAAGYVKDGIHMNSVDTGWVTDEDPIHIARRKTEENGFHPPLDIVDGAARIVDPIFDGMNTGTHVWGQFLKDYRPAAW